MATNCYSFFSRSSSDEQIYFALVYCFIVCHTHGKSSSSSSPRLFFGAHFIIIIIVSVGGEMRGKGPHYTAYHFAFILYISFQFILYNTRFYAWCLFYMSSANVLPTATASIPENILNALKHFSQFCLIAHMDFFSC